jgi:hypothetical protein
MTQPYDPPGVTAYFDPFSCTVEVADRPCGQPLEAVAEAAELVTKDSWMCPLHGPQLQEVILMPWPGDHFLPVAMHGLACARPTPSSVALTDEFNGLYYTEHDDAGRQVNRWAWMWTPHRKPGSVAGMAPTEVVLLLPVSGQLASFEQAGEQAVALPVAEEVESGEKGTDLPVELEGPVPPRPVHTEAAVAIKETDGRAAHTVRYAARPGYELFWLSMPDSGSTGYGDMLVVAERLAWGDGERREFEVGRHAADTWIHVGFIDSFQVGG